MSRSPRNVEEFRLRARRHLPRAVFDFVDGGADDEVTLRANRAQFERLRLVPRVLVDVSDRDLSTTVAGVPLRLPIIFAPAGLVGLVHPDGETAAARVAVGRGIIAVISGHATYSLEEVAQVAPGQWFDLFPWRSRSFYGEVMQRALQAGYSGLCITIDTPVVGNRERDRMNGFTIPPALLSHSLDYARHPAWIASTLIHRRGTMRNFEPGRPSITSFIRKAAASASTVGFIDQTMTWGDIEWIRENWPGPLGIKGAFGVSDAKRFADVGVDALFVGNHGGRQLDGLQPGLEQLQRLSRGVGDRIDLVLDGGVRRGTDIIKALALGARACMVGRAWVYGLAVGGLRGVESILDILESEVDTGMALLGVRSVSELDAAFVAPAAASSGWTAR